MSKYSLNRSILLLSLATHLACLPGSISPCGLRTTLVPSWQALVYGWIAMRDAA
jgi:hypothetical protein